MFGSITRVGPIFGSPVWNSQVAVEIPQCECEDILLLFDEILVKIDQIETDVTNVTTINNITNQGTAKNFDLLTKLVKRIYADQREQRQVIESMKTELRLLRDDGKPNSVTRDKYYKGGKDGFNHQK